MWQLATSLWHQLSAAERRAWESAGTTRHMTGYAWFMSQALRPNPGVYLPLAGGTMSGIIDVAGHQVTGLATPVADGDAARKKYVDDSGGGGGYTQNVRVRRSTAQTIPTGTVTTVIFNVETFDSDNMWDVANPTRLTIRTAGLYLIIGDIYWASSAVGRRLIWLEHSVAGAIATREVHMAPTPAFVWAGQVTTLWQCAVADYIELFVFHTKGSNLAISTFTERTPSLSAVRVGP